jgi:uroporphyrinogen-III synthase
LPAEFVSTKIVGILGNLEGKRVLLPRSAKGTPDLPVALRAAGATVDEIALYAPVNLPLDEEAYQQLLSGVDAVTFASGSAVRAFVEALDGDVRFATFWETVAVACIGPTTAEVARVEGLPVHVVATQHDAPGLVAALTAFYANVQPLKEPRNG